MGTQKNRLNETVLLSTQNTFNLMDKKITAILHKFVLLNWPYGTLISACKLIRLNTVCDCLLYIKKVECGY